jgi:thiol-disulfide isomerase/thioredoxin
MSRYVRAAITIIAVTIPAAAVAGEGAPPTERDVPPILRELREQVRQWQRQRETLREPLPKRVSAVPDAKQRPGDKKPGANPFNVPDGCYYFYAKSVAPCQRMSPIIERLRREGFPIAKIDIAARADWSTRYEIKVVPTLLIKNGPKLVRLTGMKDEQSLRSKLLQNDIELASALKKNHAEALVLITYPVADLLKKPGVAAPDFDPLLHLIQSVIEAESWEEAGGQGRIKAMDKTLTLVVRQTARVHAQIRFVLQELRRLKVEAPGE